MFQEHVAQQEARHSNGHKRPRNGTFCADSLSHWLELGTLLSSAKEPYVCLRKRFLRISPQKSPTYVSATPQKSPVSLRKNPVSPQNNSISPQKSPVYRLERIWERVRCVIDMHQKWHVYIYVCGRYWC